MDFDLPSAALCAPYGNWYEDGAREGRFFRSLLMRVLLRGDRPGDVESGVVRLVEAYETDVLAELDAVQLLSVVALLLLLGKGSKRGAFEPPSLRLRMGLYDLSVILGSLRGRWREARASPDPNARESSKLRTEELGGIVGDGGRAFCSR